MDTQTIESATLEGLAYARRVIGKVVSPRLIDDATQDFAVLLMVRVIPAYDPNKGTTLKTWIARAAANFARSIRRDNAKFNRHDSIGETDDNGRPLTGRELSSDAPTPFALLARKEQEQALWGALDRALSNDELGLLADLAEQGTGAVAERRGLTAGAISHAKRRAWNKVRAELGE